MGKVVWAPLPFMVVSLAVFVHSRKAMYTQNPCGLLVGDVVTGLPGGVEIGPLVGMETGLTLLVAVESGLLSVGDHPTWCETVLTSLLDGVEASSFLLGDGELSLIQSWSGIAVQNLPKRGMMAEARWSRSYSGSRFHSPGSVPSKIAPQGSWMRMIQLTCLGSKTIFTLPGGERRLNWEYRKLFLDLMICLVCYSHIYEHHELPSVMTPEHVSWPMS